MPHPESTRWLEDKYICSPQGFLSPHPECFPFPALPYKEGVLKPHQQHPTVTPSSNTTKARSCPNSTQTCLTADSPSGCICYVKPGEHFTLYYVQMLFSLHPAMNFPLPALGCHHLAFLQCSPSRQAVLKSPASAKANSQVMVLWRVLS